MKYFVYEMYDVDGGFGDAIGQTRLLGILNADTEEQAREWAKKHTHDHTYDIPYDELHEGVIEILPADVKEFTLDDCPWTAEELANLLDKRTRQQRMLDEYREQSEYPDDEYYEEGEEE